MLIYCYHDMFVLNIIYYVVAKYIILLMNVNKYRYIEDMDDIKSYDTHIYHPFSLICAGPSR